MRGNYADKRHRIERVGARNCRLPKPAHTAWLESKKAVNANKILSMPKDFGTARPPQHDEEALTRKNYPDAGKPLIAVVDDEPVIAITLAEILARRGFDAVWFTDPVQALDFIRLCKIALLLSDITMPEFDGVALAASTLRLQPECPVVLLSARSHETEVCRRIQLLGLCIQLEARPIGVERLVSTVQMALAAQRMVPPSRG